MKRSLLILAVLAVAFFGVQLPADPPATQPADPPPAPRELMAHLQKSLSTVDSIEADFVQHKRLEMLKHTLTIRGRFAMSKPNKVIWIVDEPSKYAIRVEGAEVTQWDQETNKVQVFHLENDPTFNAITQQIQAWFLGDYKVLEKSYSVYLLGDQPLSLRFVPQPGTMVAKLIRNIEVTFDKDQLQIMRMVVNETSGDTTTLEYSNTHLNQPIQSQMWEIPPK